MRLGRKHRERLLNIDFTPMIDVVFNLLIFFLVTSQMARLTRADVELPRERGEETEVAEETGLVLNVLESGAIVVSDQTVPLADLEAVVREAIRKTPNREAARLKLMIRADRRARAEHLNAVVERLHELGVGVARIATSPVRR